MNAVTDVMKATVQKIHRPNIPGVTFSIQSVFVFSKDARLSRVIPHAVGKAIGTPFTDQMRRDG